MMERWIVIGLLVLSLAWGSHAQNLGLILGITFSAVGVFIGVCIPLFIFLCVFCGVLLASKRSSQPRTVVVQPGEKNTVIPTHPSNYSSLYVNPGPSQHPPPGTYPVQPGVTYPSEEHTYPAAPYPTDSYPAGKSLYHIVLYPVLM